MEESPEDVHVYSDFQDIVNINKTDCYFFANAV